jgi:antitoxin ChpS
MKLSQRLNVGHTIMSESERWTVKCQETSDGSGDVIVDLPPELLARLGLGLGDELTIEVVNGAIVLKPKQNTSPSPRTQP